MLLDLTTGLPRTPETGGTPDTIQLGVDFQLISGANLVVDGDLTVNGTTTTISSEIVNIADNYLYLNADYTADTAQTGGIVVNVDPTTTTDTVGVGGFTAGVDAVSNPTVITTGSATFSVGDIIQISGAADQENDGIYEVLSHVGTTLTIRGVGTTGTVEDFTQNQFVTDITAQGDITHVNVAVLRSSTTGVFESAFGNTTGLTFTALGVGNVSLQDAYEAGNTITTSATEGNVVITGTEDVIISTSDLDVDTTASITLDADAVSNFTVAGANLTLSTTTSGDVLVNSAAEVDLTAGSTVDINATTTVTIDTADAADASGNDITITAGSSTAGGAAGASIILTPGDGESTGAAGDVTISSPADEDEALLTLTSNGTSGNSASIYVGSNNPDGSVTANAGSLFLRDDGASAVAYLNTSTGSGTSWTQLATGGTVTLQSAYENGNTITTSATEGDITFTGTEDFLITLSDLLVDTTASISLDADANSNFTVAAGSLTLSTTTSGNVDVTAADAVNITAGNEAASVGNSVTVTGGDGGGTNAGGTVDLVGGTGGTSAGGNGGNVTATAGAAGTGSGGDGGNVVLTTGTADGAGTNGFVDITGPNLEGEALVQLTTTGTGGDSVQMFVGDSDPSGSVTGLAGSVFFRDTGAGAEIYLNTSTGSGTTWDRLSIVSDITLQQAYEGGNTITTSATEGDFTITGTEDLIVSLSDLDVDTTASIALNADAASNFTVDTTAPGQDLTVSVAGATDSSLVLSSSGTGGDALQIIATAGGIDVAVATGNTDALEVSDGTNEYINIDSSDVTVDLNQFVDVSAAGVGIRIVTDDALVAGDLVTIATTGNVELADADTGTAEDGFVVGVSQGGFSATNTALIYTMPGSLVPVRFAAAPAGANNGDTVFLSTTPGVATLTPPNPGNHVIYQVGYLQGADGATTTPTVLFQPRLVATVP